MKKNGTVYICGDGNRMARDVQNTMAELIGKHIGGESAMDAGKAFVEEMKAKGRLVLEIWS
jgi:sulfite reductase alpha subunit-like flavoprotein